MTHERGSIIERSLRDGAVGSRLAKSVAAPVRWCGDTPTYAIRIGLAALSRAFAQAF